MEVYYEEGRKFVSYTSEELKAMRARGEDQTNMEAIKAMTEEEIQAFIAADPDDFELTEEDFMYAYRPNLGEKPPEVGRSKRMASMRLGGSMLIPDNQALLPQN